MLLWRSQARNCCAASSRTGNNGVTISNMQNLTHPISQIVLQDEQFDCLNESAIMQKYAECRPCCGNQVATSMNCHEVLMGCLYWCHWGRQETFNVFFQVVRPTVNMWTWSKGCMHFHDIFPRLVWRVPKHFTNKKKCCGKSCLTTQYRTTKVTPSTRLAHFMSQTCPSPKSLDCCHHLNHRLQQSSNSSRGS